MKFKRTETRNGPFFFCFLIVNGISLKKPSLDECLTFLNIYMVLIFYKLHEILGPKVKNNLYARENWDNHTIQLHATIGSQLTKFHCFLDLFHGRLKKPEKI